ncbi:MAG: 4,5-DOPA dioxygenase extradiol [Bacteroidetes bacterium]|nr:MAG: 4,5-DOPA dioxygenase extradiol [Bacteroidota bacterium]
MPALFIGHGHPMNALWDNDFTRTLRQIGQSLEKPNAILVISAHWQTHGTVVSTSKLPETIYDFGNFDPELFKITYPAPGAPAYAELLRETVTLTPVHAFEHMGLDHGAWTVLKFIFPHADVPVFQLSLDYDRPAAWHYALAQELKPLRERGVLIMGSGNIVHNLRILDWHNIDAPTADWATEYDAFVKARLLDADHKPLIQYETVSQAARLSVPSNEHYLPMLYTAALQAPGEELRFMYEGFQFANISMRAFRVG